MLVFLTSAITSTLRAQVRCGWYDIWLHFILVYVKIAIRPCQNKIIAESNRCASHGMPTLISVMAPTTDYWLTWNNSTGMPGQIFILIKSQYHNRDRTSDRKLESQKFILDSCTNFHFGIRIKDDQRRVFSAFTIIEADLYIPHRSQQPPQHNKAPFDASALRIYSAGILGGDKSNCVYIALQHAVWAAAYMSRMREASWVLMVVFNEHWTS